MTNLLAFWLAGAVLTLLTFKFRLGFKILEQVSSQQPAWLKRVEDQFTIIENAIFTSHETPFSERLALHPFKTAAKLCLQIIVGFGYILTMLVFVLSALGLWPITWSIIGLMYIRKVYLLRKRLMAH